MQVIEQILLLPRIPQIMIPVIQRYETKVLQFLNQLKQMDH